MPAITCGHNEDSKFLARKSPSRRGIRQAELNEDIGRPFGEGLRQRSFTERDVVISRSLAFNSNSEGCRPWRCAGKMRAAG
jgi:hypothetical protein